MPILDKSQLHFQNKHIVQNLNQIHWETDRQNLNKEKLDSEAKISIKWMSKHSWNLDVKISIKHSWLNTTDFETFCIIWEIIWDSIKVIFYKDQPHLKIFTFHLGLFHLLFWMWFILLDERVSEH